MKIEVQELSPAQIQLTITASDDILVTARKKAIKTISKEVKVDGFRAGHVPEKVIIQKVGEDYIKGQTQMEALNEAYRIALEEKNIQPVDQPTDLDITSEEPLTFTLKVEVLPKIKVDDSYKKIKVDSQDTKVTDKEVDEIIEETSKRFTTYEEAADAKADMGDRVTINFRGMEPKDDTPLANTDGREQPVVLGDGMFIPGFEEELKGMKAGEEKDFTVTFPADYHHKPFQNKEVKFHAEVVKVEKSVAPEFTEEFIEKLRGKKMDLAAFKQDTREMLEKEKNDQERARREDVFLDEAAKKFVNFEIPHAIAHQELDQMINEMKQRIASQGLRFEDYLSHLGKTEHDLHNDFHDDAHKRSAKRLVLTALLDYAEVEVTDADIDAEIDKVAARFEKKEHKEQVRSMYEDKGKARDAFSSQVKITKFFDSVLN